MTNNKNGEFITKRHKNINIIKNIFKTSSNEPEKFTIRNLNINNIISSSIINSKLSALRIYLVFLLILQLNRNRCK